jgi:hypothetical protein
MKRLFGAFAFTATLFCANALVWWPGAAIAQQNIGAPELSRAIAGSYVRQPILNDWHIGAIVIDADGMRWANKAGSVWKLTAHLPNLKLHTGPDNPYYAQFRDIDLLIGNGQLVGLQINGEPYLRNPPVTLAKEAPQLSAQLTAQPWPKQCLSTVQQA